MWKFSEQKDRRITLILGISHCERVRSAPRCLTYIPSVRRRIVYFCSGLSTTFHKINEIASHFLFTQIHPKRPRMWIGVCIFLFRKMVLYTSPQNYRICQKERPSYAISKGSYYLNYRRFTIRDQYCHEGMFGTVGQKGNFEYPYLETIATSLVPFMLKLNSYGGWDAYMHHIYPNHPNANRMIWDDREY